MFVAHGNLDEPAKGRLKFVIQRMGADAFRAAWSSAFAEAVLRDHPPVADVELMAEADHAEILAESPPGGWGAGVRPQRLPGTASVTIDVPLGDIVSNELELFCDLADRHADGYLTLTRDQNITLRNVPLAAGGGDPPHARPSATCSCSARAGTPRSAPAPARRSARSGSPTRPRAGRDLSIRDSLRRNPTIRVFASGCPNACAQHQIADIGLAGSKVRVAGKTVDGYQVYLGADLDQHLLGEVVGRVGDADLGPAVDAIVGTWEALAPPRRDDRPHRPAHRARRLRQPGHRGPARPLGGRRRPRAARRGPRRQRRLSRRHPVRRTRPPSPTRPPPTVRGGTVPIPVATALEENADLAAVKAESVRALPRYLASSALAGAYVGIAVVLLISVSAPLVAAGSGAAKLVQAAVFGIALTLVVFAGAELFTGNVMVMLQGWWRATTTPAKVAAVLVASLVGNIVGSIVLGRDGPRRRDDERPGRRAGGGDRDGQGRGVRAAAVLAGRAVQRPRLPGAVDGRPHPVRRGQAGRPVVGAAGLHRRRLRALDRQRHHVHPRRARRQHRLGRDGPQPAVDGARATSSAAGSSSASATPGSPGPARRRRRRQPAEAPAPSPSPATDRRAGQRRGSGGYSASTQRWS